MGRFISEDQHWNPSNMIYGDGENDEFSAIIKRQQTIQRHVESVYSSQGMTSDKKLAETTRWRLGQLTPEERQVLEYEIAGIQIPSFMAIIQSGNLYMYGMNNPIAYVDPTGEDAGVVLAGSWALGGGTALVDGPLPFGDIIGVGVGIVGSLIAGGVAIYDAINYAGK